MFSESVRFSTCARCRLDASFRTVYAISFLATLNTRKIIQNEGVQVGPATTGKPRTVSPTFPSNVFIMTPIRDTTRMKPYPREKEVRNYFPCRREYSQTSVVVAICRGRIEIEVPSVILGGPDPERGSPPSANPRTPGGKHRPKYIDIFIAMLLVTLNLYLCYIFFFYRYAPLDLGHTRTPDKSRNTTVANLST